ncbi:MAG TPA: hypothetical protein PKA55_02175 [Rhodoblastus sp.]|nr:hypothetical protein [Rhodoblastus sp.]
MSVLNRGRGRKFYAGETAPGQMLGQIIDADDIFAMPPFVIAERLPARFQEMPPKDIDVL